MESDPTLRFSSRVEDYIRYRPSYPRDVIHWLERACGLSPQSRVADIGSGTGILAGLFLDHGCEVFGVEPNEEMRHAGERILAEEARFHSVAGRAEATTLPANSFDFVTAGQSFHWFEPDAARTEFRRILKPGGWVVLVWNERLVTDGFLAAYEELLHRYSPDYASVDHRRIDSKALGAFFGHDNWMSETFQNYQDLDWAGLTGRLLSSSYAPQQGSPNYQPMMDELAGLYEAWQKYSWVRIAYDTKVYAGKLDEAA